MSPLAIVVLGMHRSGTSALARCCALLGGELGPRLLDARPDNEAGFWEDPEIVAADDEALLALRLVWSDFWPIDSAAWLAEPLRRASARLAGIARDRVVEGRPWVVKDPRISRLVPMWLAALDQAGVEPGFVLCLRDPAEIAASLGRRDGLSPAHCELLWLRYVVESELHTRGRRRAFVRYPDLLDDWRPAMAAVARDLSLEWPIAPEAAAAAIDSFLRPSLRHHVAGGSEPGRSTAVAPWVAAAAEGLERLARGDERGGRDRLDRVRSEIEAADATVSRVAREVEARMFGHRHDAEVLRAEVERVLAELDRVAAERDALRVELDRTSRELAAASETLEGILRSRSWQATAALRSIAGRLRGVLRPRRT